MQEADLLAIRAGPTVQVTLRPRPSVPAQPAPHHAVPDAELARQRRHDGRVTKSVRRIQHVEATSQTVRIRGAEQQVPDQAFARRDLLVWQNVPGTHLQPARLPAPPAVLL